MSDYEVIFGLDCVGGDQAPIDCAVVRTSDGKPGLMLDGEVFTKESLTPVPAVEAKIPVIYPYQSEETPNPCSVVIMDGDTPIAGSPTTNVCVYGGGGGASTRTANFAVGRPGVTIEASKAGDHTYITIFYDDATSEMTTDPDEPVTIPDGTVLVTVTYKD